MVKGSQSEQDKRWLALNSCSAKNLSRVKGRIAIISKIHFFTVPEFFIWYTFTVPWPEKAVCLFAFVELMDKELLANHTEYC